MPKHILSKEQEQYIIDQHLNKNRSSKNIAEEFGYTQKVIKRILLKNGIQPVNHLIKYPNLKIDVFKKINNPETAYWIGFISEDGHIAKSGYSLSIKLQGKDRNHLYKLADFLNVPHELVKTEYHNITNNELCSLTISRKEIIQDLNNLGIVNNKNCGNEKVIHIPKEYMNDYLRGVIDANGNICKRNFNIISSVEVLQYIKDYFNSIYDMGATKILDHCNTYRMYICKNRKEILNDIYYDNCICLDRKYEIIKNLYT